MVADLPPGPRLRGGFPRLIQAAPHIVHALGAAVSTSALHPFRVELDTPGSLGSHSSLPAPRSPWCGIGRRATIHPSNPRDPWANAPIAPMAWASLPDWFWWSLAPLE